MRNPLPCLARLLAPLLLPGALCAQGTLLLQLQDYAPVPLSGQLTGSTDNSIYVARVNFLREEPGGGANRLFVNDLNGKLYIFDQTTRQFATYLDFHRNTTENVGANGLFSAFTRANGYANGFVTFQFDPEYRTAGSPNFGKFYTVHIELDTNDGDPRRMPNASNFSGYSNAAAYSPTTAFEAPGNDNANTRHAVLIEWQDTNPADTTFQGTAREIMRIEFNGRIHPMGDLAFSPRALSDSDPDWRKMYIAVGDGGAGEQINATLHATPQRLDVMHGKILRISPDNPDGDGPRRYGIPTDNPFADGAPVSGIVPRPETWAWGFRNPHRISWDPLSNALIAADIGFHSWEEVNIVRKGINYGWGEREGTFVFTPQTGLSNTALPANDAASNYVYPVIQYPHSPALGVGDAVAGGFVYRGTRIPALRGKFIFGDITTGELFYSDFVEMISADDGDPATLAAFHSIDLMWASPRLGTGLQRYDRMYEIVVDEYRARGGRDTDLPGSATVSDLTGGGRADIRLAVDNAGELYVLSKSDGMIRSLSAYQTPAPFPPAILRQPMAQMVALGSTVVFSVTASADATTYQWQRNGIAIPGANQPMLILYDVSAAEVGAYTVQVGNGNTATPVLSAPATLTIAFGNAPGRIANFSIRSAAGTGAQTLITGFALSGPPGAGDQPLLVRGIGPSLANFGVTGFLPDPTLELYRGATRLLQNDNWDSSSSAAVLAGQRGAFALTANSRDAVLLPDALAAGAYTVQIGSAVSSQTGIALAEIFDSPTSSRQLTNVSARTQVGSGENILIAGFVITGTTARTVMIRAAGPALAPFGVTGRLADPELTLYRNGAVIASNSNWQSSAALVDVFARTGAFNFTARSNDAVLFLTLPPGAYSAHVSGLGTGTAATGVALVEVYTLP
ncbi:MAG: PQQ-dependent sugar dehydrogenase [Verrucomicrobiota bacterium]